MQGWFIRYFRTKTLYDYWFLLTRSFRIHRDGKRLLAEIDHDAMKHVQDRYASKTRAENPWLRFLKPEENLSREAFRAHRYGMCERGGRNLRHLDLGTGPGYFCFVCSSYGHETIGVDIEVPLLARVAEVLGVDRRIWTIDRECTPPPFSGKFDVITAFQIGFDGTIGKQPDPWRAEDWERFLTFLLSNHLADGGRVVITGVRSCLSSSKFFDPKVVDLLRSRGARVGQGKIEISEWR
ncbi:MAG: hypothetical protein HOI66_06155 [Verrucomicrobia bacterium]|jgi:hypothetical protein|nr:hypothetical protein [Verrucomicrobiota bacterium]MDA7667626.1 class I SAM-dependent methyltransferase [bacterium]MDB4746052.1 class I SAM-dependent methyltransferase [Verrucomicrobiota bacterium]